MDLNDFNDLADVGRVRKTVKVGRHEFELQTLNAGEYSRMAARLGDDSAGTTKRLEALQRETIIAAIVSVDGKELSYDEKSKLYGFLQLGVSNLLYDTYVSIVEEQNRILEESKKNSAPMTTGSAA